MKSKTDAYVPEGQDTETPTESTIVGEEARARGNKYSDEKRAELLKAAMALMKSGKSG